MNQICSCKAWLIDPHLHLMYMIFFSHPTNGILNPEAKLLDSAKKLNARAEVGKSYECNC